MLGSVATFWPQIYLTIFHPELVAPQVELVQRTGILWLMLAAVALRAATAAPTQRARWFLVLAVLRFMDVPADIVYVLNATGITALGQVLLWSAPPLNIAIGTVLWRLASRDFNARALSAPTS